MLDCASEQGNGDCKDFPLSWCLLIKSSLLNYVPCRRCGDFNLSKLISPFSTGELMESQRHNVT